MSIKVLFFGKLADIAQASIGQSTIDYPYTESLQTLDQLRISIIKSYPTLKAELENTANLCAVNQEMCQISIKLVDGDEVTFMSPFSGG